MRLALLFSSSQMVARISAFVRARTVFGFFCAKSAVGPIALAKTSSWPGPSCEAAFSAVNLDPNGTYTTVSLPGNPNQQLTWNPNHGSNLAAGCLLTAYPISGNGSTSSQPVARCLYRFGVLLALDDATHKFWPNLPVADAYEQSIAQHISP